MNKKRIGTKLAAVVLRVIDWDIEAPLGIELKIIKRKRSNDQNALYM